MANNGQPDDHDPVADAAPSYDIDGPPEEDDHVGEVVVSTGSSGTDDGGPLEIPARLPVLPIRNSCVFPGTVVPLQVNRDKSKRVLDLALAGSRLIAVVAQRSAQTEDPRLDDLYRIGTACVILKMLKAPDGSENIIVHGLRRVGLEAITKEDDYLEAQVNAYNDPDEVTTEQKALAHMVRNAADRIIRLSPNIPEEALQVLNAIERPGGLADFLAANLSLGFVHEQGLLETFDVTERLRKVNVAVAAQLEVAELSGKLQQQVRAQVDKSQREYFLREQMKAIQTELGDREGTASAIEKLRERVAAAKLPEAVQTEAVRELDRMEHIPQASPEYSMALDYVEWLAELPWSVTTEDNLSIQRAAEILDADHYGLDKVKKRILEFLAVRQLKKDSRGPILCFAGPPGVGKTSLGQSIARALGRNFIRISLGGIRDEATIRGHRRTYVGAMPGRIMREIRRAASNNPLFMLDEVDKIGQDVRGDPMSALLEVLDPAQNSTFSDHYLSVPFDLSKVLFIATANYMSAVEPALRDRMEIIELNGYTHREKLEIARRHLLPRQIGENGLKSDQIIFSDEILALIIGDYTREAGVRGLERKIGAVCRARAASVVRGEVKSTAITVDDIGAMLGPREFESEVAATARVPGVVTGLAYTAAGGDILFIEAAAMPGNGQLKLTGQLGDVMRESAMAAASIIRVQAGLRKVSADQFGRVDLHVHVPAGAIPKDGPSAGVAMLAAMTSVLTGKTVDPTTGMTGEITLSGRVLPVGGIREKVLAGFRAGLKRIIMPARNEQDLEEVPEDVRRNIEFVFVRTTDELLGALFDGKRAARSAKSKRVARSKPAPKGSKAKRRARTGSKSKSAKSKTALPKGAKRKRTSKKRAEAARNTAKRPRKTTSAG